MKSKILACLLSVVVAFGLWLYVITVVSPESEKTYYEIPVVLQNKEVLAERGLMIVSDTPTVTLALKGKRIILNELNEANINVLSNVANIEKPGTHRLTYDLSFPGNVADNEVSVTSSSTDLITLKIENKIKKPIPVVIDYGGSAVPEGFIADLKNAQLDYPSIMISGPESVVSLISQACIEVDLTDQTKTLIGEYQYTLLDSEGNPQWADLVLNDPQGLSNAVNKYSGAHSSPIGIQMEYFVRLKNTEAACEAVDTWIDNTEVSKHYYSTGELTEDEQIAYTDKFAAINTYINEMTQKFMMGTESLDKIDAFYAQLETMGIQDCLAIQQAAYERYLAK